ncbi:MAG: hypothetical protein R3E31_05540 [Chloroflexota bacterium]
MRNAWAAWLSWWQAQFLPSQPAEWFALDDAKTWVLLGGLLGEYGRFVFLSHHRAAAARNGIVLGQQCRYGACNDGRLLRAGMEQGGPRAWRWVGWV